MNDAIDVEQQFFNLMMESQYWPQPQMQSYQREKLSSLLNHARVYVPFYEKRLDAIFNNDGSINWNRWRDLPILTRQDLAQSHEAMQASHMFAEYGGTGKFTSSGTTGAPVTTTHNAYANWANRAAIIRSYKWYGIDWNKNLCEWVYIPDAEQRDASTIKTAMVGSWGAGWDKEQTGQFWQVDRRTEFPQVLEFLKSHNISYMSMPPKHAHMMALEALKSGIKVKLDAITTMGMGIEPEDREACKKAFGAEMYALYSSKECHKIAYQCPTGHHFHIMSEMGLVEILNDQNEPCKPGEIGRVIITPFFNFAQPLVRYDQGDLAEVGDPCSCGRTLPVIRRIAGRTIHMFRFPGGVKIAPSLDIQFRNALNCEIWQVAQIAPLAIEIRYLADAEASEEAKAFVAAEVPRTMRADVEVTFKRIDKMPLTPAGKYVQYICELPEGAA